MKPKILLIDSMFPNKYTSWRNLFVESFLREFNADIAVYKTTKFAGIDYEYDYEFVLKNYDVDICKYNQVKFDLPGKSVLEHSGKPPKLDIEHEFSYVFTKNKIFDIHSYDIIFFIFYSTYMKFSSQFKNVVAKQIIYLFPGGGFDFYSKFSLDFQPHYISTHPYSSKILKDAGVKFIECLGGPHSRYSDKPDLNNYHKFKSAEKLIVNFSSMGFSAEKGDKKFVTIAKIYRTIFFWHKIQFTSVGNCKKSIFVRNYKIMDFVSLNNFYINFVDIQINMATFKASNGWPLGVEALRAGCVLITTDPNKVSKAYLLSNSLFIVNNIFQVILAIWKLYSKPNYYLDKQRLQRDFYLRNFSYQVQQQKIFDWIYAIFTNR